MNQNTNTCLKSRLSPVHNKSQPKHHISQNHNVKSPQEDEDFFSLTFNTKQTISSKNSSTIDQPPQESTEFIQYPCEYSKIKTIRQEDQLRSSYIEPLSLSTTDMQKPDYKTRLKNNIAFLAYNASVNQQELDAFHAHCHKAQKETRNKYGF